MSADGMRPDPRARPRWPLVAASIGAALLLAGCTAELPRAADAADASAAPLDGPVTARHDSRPRADAPTPPPPADAAGDPRDGAVQSGDATTAAPDAGVPADATTAFCPHPAGATAFAMAGAFTPSPAQPTRTFNIAAAGARSIASVTLELELTHGGWYTGKANGAHGIFQLTRAHKWASNLFGYLTLRDSPSKLVRVISNIDLAQGDRDQLQQTKLLQPGTTYHVLFSYQPANQRRRLLLTANNSTVVDTADNHVPATVTSAAPGYQLILATPLLSGGPEVPTYGWVYRRVCLTVRYR